MATETKNQCVQYVCSDNLMVHPCGATGKVQIEGRWYCGTHDPVRRAAKEKARQEERSRRWAEADERRERISRIAALKEAVVQAALKHDEATVHDINVDREFERLHDYEATWFHRACIALREAMAEGGKK